MLVRDGFTYVSDAWSTTSWIDHFVCSQDAHEAISSIDICYDYVTSDHLPIHVCVLL